MSKAHRTEPRSVDALMELKEPLPQPEAEYRVGRWHDLPNYECLRCPFATLQLADMEEHLNERHREPRTLIYGPDGLPL